MWSYQYKHGDKPLEGFTIQRAAGRGGFGEVYYAISDAGREVALKAVTTYEQIELRGISQCMNLKSPHLVTIFDVKHNAEGRPFVVMEFVGGLSLRQLIDEHPSGLGEQKAAFFLREMAKGLTFLHECGIVHRDLKPANIFYENGYVKIGDYGLSKSITMSQHSGQTVTVGTVHYMAPEVGAGKYDRGIDIYALGAVLYEMLIGMPPFVGASPSEVLLKHLSAQPDCSNISEPFATTIKRAMAKDPNERFKSVQEMVEAVFGAEHIQRSVSVFASEELSVVADRVAKHITAAGGAGGSNQPNRPVAVLEAPNDPWGRAARHFDEVGQRLAQRFNGYEEAADPSRDMTVPVEDTLPARSRVILAVVTALVMAISGAVLTPSRIEPPVVGIFIFVGIFGAMGGLMAFRRWFAPRLRHDSRLLRRLLASASAAIALTFTGGWIFAADRMGHYPITWLGLIVPLFIFDLERFMRPERRERVHLGHVIAMCAVAFALSIAGLPQVAVAVIAGIALVAQALSPWSPRAFVQARNPSPAGANPNMPVHPIGGANDNMNIPGNAMPVAMSQGSWSTEVSQVIRVLWAAAFALLFSLAIAFWVAAGNSNQHDFPPLMGLGCGFAILSIFSFIRILTRRFYGIWSYLGRPLLMVACATAIIASAVVMGTSRLRGEEIGVATFFIIFPMIVMLVSLFIPGKRSAAIAPVVVPPPVPASTTPAAYVSPYKRVWALILALGGFIGICGLQRFYVGKIGTGVLWLVTGGLAGFGQIVDGILIVCGAFTDKDGRKLEIWESESELSGAGTGRVVGEHVSPLRAIAHAAPGSHLAGLLSALAGMLIFVGAVAGVALTVDLPGAIAAGAFGPKPANEALRAFDGYLAWPLFVYKIGFLGDAILLSLGLIVQVFARRGRGGLHIFRGLAGCVMLVFALLILNESFSPQQAWEGMAPLVEARRIPAAMHLVLNQFDESAIAALLAFLSAMVLFAWQPRRQNPEKAG